MFSRPPKKSPQGALGVGVVGVCSPERTGARGSVFSTLKSRMGIPEAVCKIFFSSDPAPRALFFEVELLKARLGAASLNRSHRSGYCWKGVGKSRPMVYGFHVWPVGPPSGARTGSGD
jgi:hypothetical protein